MDRSSGEDETALGDGLRVIGLSGTEADAGTKPVRPSET